jgi:hypothetical protein
MQHLPSRCLSAVQRWTRRVALLAAFPAFLATAAVAQPAAEAPKRTAVIIVGLPGDGEHEKIFRETCAVWSTWCADVLQVPPDRLVVLTCASAGAKNETETVASRERIEQTFKKVSSDTSEADALWVFLLGHGHFDGDKAQFHLPGSDLNPLDLADMLGECRCREQVVWLTQPSSGGWVKALAREGRTVIASTADETEENETEFPQALAKTMKLPAAELDQDRDQKISLLELFQRTVQETQARFDADKRLATEHAQLDDNGDGRGTEIDKLARPLAPVAETPAASGVAAAPVKPQDGEAARRMIVGEAAPPPTKP